MAEMESFLFMLSNSYFPNKNTSGIALLLSWNSLEIDLSDWSDTLSGMEIKMAGTRCWIYRAVGRLNDVDVKFANI